MPNLYERYGDVKVSFFVSETNPKGVEFSPVEGVNYKHDYISIAKAIADGEFTNGNMQSLIVSDLWFLCYFIICNGAENINDGKGWFVECAKEVGNLYETDTLDLWGRFHGKSLLLTIGKTVQYHLLHPEHCTLILSFKKGAAEAFQKAIMAAYESPIMLHIFPMRLYDNPSSQAPSWGLEKGACIKRENKSRKENTIQSSGLVEGMLTGGHFERLLFDDIVTVDTCQNVDGMEKCFKAFEFALNLGTGSDKDIVCIAGTYYHHLDPLTKIKALTFPDGRSVYKERKKPSTDDGTAKGVPVLVSDDYMEKLKLRGDFNTQHLLDPTPKGEQELDGGRLQIIQHQFIPTSGVATFMLIDPAGDATKDGCDWAIGKVIVKPDFQNLSLSKIYITDLLMAPFSHAEAISAIVSVYLRGDYVHQVGIEDDRSMTHKFVISELGSKGRVISENMGNLKLLKHQGRNKDNRIASAWQWPLVNDKCFISSRIPAETIEKLKTQLNNFPFGLKDGIDMLAYLPDMITEFQMWPANYEDDEDDKRDEKLYDNSTVNPVTGY